MPRKYTIRSKEEKISIVRQVLKGASVRQWEGQGVDHRVVQDWVKKYQAEGETGLEPKKKPCNPLSRYERRKKLTYEEQLQYQIELIKKRGGGSSPKKTERTKRGRYPKKMLQEMYAEIQKQTDIPLASYAASMVYLAVAATSGSSEPVSLTALKDTSNIRQLCSGHPQP